MPFAEAEGSRPPPVMASSRVCCRMSSISQGNGFHASQGDPSAYQRLSLGPDHQSFTQSARESLKGWCRRTRTSPTRPQNHSATASSELFTLASGVVRLKASVMERFCTPSAAMARIG